MLFGVIPPFIFVIVFKLLNNGFFVKFVFCVFIGQLRVHTHNLVQYEAVSPTCTENGYDEHWVCEGENGCGKIFSDEDAKNELDVFHLTM